MVFVTDQHYHSNPKANDQICTVVGNESDTHCASLLAQDNKLPPVLSSVAYKCPKLLRQSNLVLQSWGDPGLEDLLDIPGSSDSFMSLSHSCTRCPEDPLDIPGSSLPEVHLPSDKGPMLSGGFLRHPRILLWCPFRHVQAPMLSGGSLGHPGILPSCPLKQITNDVYKTVVLVNILISMMEVEWIS